MMKKIILTMCLAFAFSQTTNAQIDFGIKGGINYNSESIQEVKDDVFSGAKSKTGFHAGIWTRFKLPIVGLYIRPELVYTSLKSEVTYKQTIPVVSGFEPINSQTTYSFQKIDIPILLGKKFLGGVLNVFGGPSFQYILDSDFSINDISDVKAEGFSVGLQLGAGVEFGKLGVDVRWERGFSDTETKFIDKNILNTNLNFDTRVNQIIIGLSYQL